MKYKTILFMTATLFLVAACGGDNMTGSVVSDAPGQYDEFAKCISEEGAKMYGAYWCPHCQRQKDMFGSSFEHVTYIECSLPNRQGQTKVCKMANIQSYPTWEFSDGSRRGGVLQLEELANETDCELPGQA